jgi:hypothetical protein
MTPVVRATLGGVRRALALALAVLAAVVAGAGCGDTPNGGSDAAPKVPPVRLAGLLPTANGLRDASASRPADALAIQTALADGRAEPSAARKLTDLGLRKGAIRTWTAPGGGHMAVVISEWSNHYAATSVGGDSAELALSLPGAQAWTPTQLASSRGVKVDTPGHELRTISFAVDSTDLFVRAEGPIPETVVIRAMQRMIAALGAGPAPTG